MRTHRLVATLAAAVITVTAACGGGPAPEASDADLTPPRSEPAVTSTSVPPTPPSTSPEADHTSTVARTEFELEVYTHPSDPMPERTLPATTGFGSRRALLVVGDDAAGDWLEVLLPVRPNGTTGWIRRADVELRTIDTEVVVDLGARTLTVTQAGEIVLQTSVAIGSDESPTPTGRFSVVDKIDTANPDGPYGPFAFGLSGHSDVLTEFAGGEGQIGIHGTSDPTSIGQAASHGCVRVPNEVAVALNSLLPLGTPVTIV